jgi:flagellar hook-basal body complex protein FliE
MSTIQTEISNVLAQIRELSQQFDAGVKPAQQPESGEGFGVALKDAIDAVSAQQKAADSLMGKFQAGDKDTSIAEVVVEMQKASISFQAMSEARNRIVDAYREIMNMSV